MNKARNRLSFKKWLMLGGGRGRFGGRVLNEEVKHVISKDDHQEPHGYHTLGTECKGALSNGV